MELIKILKASMIEGALRQIKAYQTDQFKLVFCLEIKLNLRSRKLVGSMTRIADNQSVELTPLALGKHKVFGNFKDQFAFKRNPYSTTS